MLERMLLGVSAVACVGVVAAQVGQVSRLGDGAAVLAVASLSTCLARQKEGGRG